MYTFTFFTLVEVASWLDGFALQRRGLIGSRHLQNYALISGTGRPREMRSEAINSQNSHFDMLSKRLLLSVFAIWRRGVSNILEEKGVGGWDRVADRHQCYSISATKDSGYWNRCKGTNYERDGNGRQLASSEPFNAYFSVSPCSLCSLQKSKKCNYLMFGLMKKERKICESYSGGNCHFSFSEFFYSSNMGSF